MLPRLAVTAGEPAGIGPELVLRLATSSLPADLIVIADPAMLERTAKRCGLSLQLRRDDGTRLSQREPGTLRIVDAPMRVAETPGAPDPRNAFYVLNTLARAADGCLDGSFDAVVTGPVQKSTINDSGEAFHGHTEFFAERTGAEVVMMLASDRLRVALATTHMPLSAVPAAITGDRLERVLRIVHAELGTKFGFVAPRIAVLGLNPHAGESGHLGREEIEVMQPLLAKLRGEGMCLLGPLPADTAFTPAFRDGYDAVLAMYHDQALPTLKAEAFDSAVNITLGLPFIRTSVDHGTALDLAGTGRANPASMMAAAKLALLLIAKP